MAQASKIEPAKQRKRLFLSSILSLGAQVNNLYIGKSQ